MFNSHTNHVLDDLRTDRIYAPDLSTADRAEEMFDYITDGFGTVALDDGIYSPEELDHARKVLRLYTRLVELSYTPFIADNGFRRAMAAGHQNRKGHELTGYYKPTGESFVTVDLVRTCCQ